MAKKKPYGVEVSIKSRTGSFEDNELLTDEGAYSAGEQAYKRQVLEDVVKDAIEKQVAQWQLNLVPLGNADDAEGAQNAIDWGEMLRQWQTERGRV